MKKLSIVLLAFIFCIGCAQQEENFPAKPITIVVPWDVGGGTDGLARAIADQASKVFGVNVNVLNKPGGSGTVGHTYGMNVRPDGYTITMITYELCSYKPLGRAPIDDTDFKALLQLNEDPGAITVHSNSKWKNMDEFIQFAKENPKQITVGNSGPGAVWHLGAVKLERLTGAKFSHIPLDGAGPAVARLLGEHINAVAVSPAEVLQYVEDGTFRCLGIMSEERYVNLPDVPTMMEQGIELVHGTWRGLATPKETPDDITEILEAGFTEAYQKPAFQKTAKKALWGLKYRDSEAFTKFLRSESESIAELVKELGLG